MFLFSCKQRSHRVSFHPTFLQLYQCGRTFLFGWQHLCLWPVFSNSYTYNFCIDNFGKHLFYDWINNFFLTKMYSRIIWRQNLLHHHQIFQTKILFEKIYAFQDTLWNYRFYEKYFFSSSFNHLFVNSKNSISLLFPCVCKLLVGNGKVRYNIKANHAHTHNCNSCKHLWDMLCLSY